MLYWDGGMERRETMLDVLESERWKVIVFVLMIHPRIAVSWVQSPSTATAFLVLTEPFFSPDK